MKINKSSQLSKTKYLVNARKSWKIVFLFPTTAKPVELLEWLLLTFTNENDFCFDPFAGSGTLGVAALRHKRKFLLIEKDFDYYTVAKIRLELAQTQIDWLFSFDCCILL